MSSEIIFEQATVGRNECCIALRRSDGEIRDADIFKFGDENAYGEAFEICEELDEGDYHDETCIVDGEVGSTPCLFVFENHMSNSAKIFYFDNERDLNTACEMACRFIELADDDSEE